MSQRAKKIVWVDIYTETVPKDVYPGACKIWPVMSQYLQSLVRKDTQLEIKYLQRSAYFVASSYMEMLNNIEIIDAVIEAEREGADAVIIGCAGDPALQQAREVVDIPVIGLLEASMHIAATLGHRFSVVVPSSRLIPVVEERIKLYGLQELALKHRPSRAFELNFDKFEEQLTNPRAEVIPAFEKAALSCIEEGAEVIIPACAYLGPGLISAGYQKVGATKVPIIDVSAVGVKMAEAMVELQRLTGLSTSKHCAYQLPLPADKLDHYRAPFYSRA